MCWQCGQTRKKSDATMERRRAPVGRGGDNRAAGYYAYGPVGGSPEQEVGSFPLFDAFR